MTDDIKQVNIKKKKKLKKIDFTEKSITEYN